MPFDQPKQMLTGLLKIELPGQDIRLCEGAFVYFAAEKYVSSDPDFGSIEAVEPFEEDVGNEAPSGRLTFLPASTAAAAELSQPEFQGARMRFWLARVDEATGTTVESELLADMQLDATRLRVGRGTRKLEVEFISSADRLFNINEGNVLSPRFHKSVWAGELGLDNATGVPLTKAWGVRGGPRGAVAGTGAAIPRQGSAAAAVGNEFSRL